MDGAGSVFSDIIPFLRELVPSYSVLSLREILRLLIVLAAAVIAVTVIKRVIAYAASKTRRGRYFRNHPLIKTLESLEGAKSASRRRRGRAPAISPRARKLSRLIRECVRLGGEIDRHTNREGFSARASRLVYAMLKDEDTETRLLISLCATVYDAGFLDLNERLFYTDVLNKRERAALETHVVRGIYHFNFVDEEYRDLFLSASAFHHENMDGSGYAEGLSGEEIPYEARVIRAADTFTALTGARNYRRAMSAADAIVEMKRNASWFDPAVLELLEKTVLKK